MRLKKVPMLNKVNFMILLFLLNFAIGVVTRAPVKHDPPSLTGATGWINTRPLSQADLRGKVVLVEFWTYTCINWRRTLPYVRVWAEKYKEAGLLVIGVSTPEFTFEREISNVRWAVREMQMDFPIAIDNDYAIWGAFNNQYWPALYFIDAQGRIRHHQFGEGNYEQSEKLIQQLLAEAGAKDVSSGISPVEPHGFELGADQRTLGSGETYVGYWRTTNFSAGLVDDKPHAYVPPATLEPNHWAVEGDWTVGGEAATLNKAGGRVIFRFHARDVNLIMGLAKPGIPVRFRITIDGKAPGTANGVDVDEQGNGVLIRQRMYQLIRQQGHIIDREVSIEFPDPGAEVFDFTFG